jgi:MFS-type transporter involved in bile tolerance (Atg22 family)
MMAIAALPMIISLYLLLWIDSFVDSGYLKSTDDAKNIYSHIIATSVVFLMLTGPLIGSAADKLSLTVMVPLSFLMRATVTISFFLYVDKPDSPWTIPVILVMVTCTVIENVMIQKLFMRTLPDDIRGTMIGVIHLFG